MTTTYFIAGTIFMVASGFYFFFKWRAGINKNFEEAKSDALKAVDSHSTGDLLDAIRRMYENR